MTEKGKLSDGVRAGSINKNVASFQQARKLAQQGRIDLAEQIYARVLEVSPTEVEAAVFLADCGLQRRETTRVLALLERSLRDAPSNPHLMTRLGLAYEQSGNSGAAIDVFSRTLATTPHFYVAGLYLGALQERLAQKHQALISYFRAITTAQKAGRWLSPDSTELGLRAQVNHAMEYVHRGRRQLFSALISPLRARYGAEAMARVEHCLDVYLGDKAPEYTDSRQRPTFLYFPGLPTHPTFERKLFPWLEAFEAQTDQIRRELQNVLAVGAELEPFHKFSDAVDVEHLIQSPDGAPVWNAFFFYRNGKRYESNCEQCPHTTSVIDSLPIPRIRDHAPEICFSVLKPGTHIMPHRGVTNTRVVMHLPLIVPGDCVLNIVNGERHYWQEGRYFAFDDTFEHEAWNHSDKTRVILLMDIWNPYLTEAECLAITEIVEGIGDFNRECGGA